MSDPILPLRQWPAGIQQASVPANDNALRVEALSRPCLGVANDASGTDADGDVWLVGSAATGAFASFGENDIALFSDDSWYAWAPVDGLRLVVNDVRKVYVGGSTDAWEDDTSGGGSGAVESVVAGTGISVDNTDPANPIVNVTGSGSGDVTGPASSTDDRIATFDGTTGKAIQDGGKTIADLLVLDVSTPSNSSGTVTLDFGSKSRYVGSITLSANVTTLAFSNLPGSGKYAEYELHIKQDATGSRTFAIPASHKALGGSDTAIASAANAVTVLTASTVDNGTTWRYAMQESA